LIFIPLGLVLLVWRMPLTLLGVSDASTERIGFLAVSVTMAWTMVWLLGHWLKCSHRIATFFLILGPMVTASLLSYYSHAKNIDWNSITGYGFCVLVLLLAMMFNSHFCRKRCTPRQFLGWLILWNGLVAWLVMLTFFVALTATMLVIHPNSQLHVWELMASAAIIPAVESLTLGSSLYLLNLPFLILAFKSPFYRERFESLFGVAVVRQSDVEAQ